MSTIVLQEKTAVRNRWVAWTEIGDGGKKTVTASQTSVLQPVLMWTKEGEEPC